MHTSGRICLVFLMTGLCLAAGVQAANITIVESQSANNGHNMDLNWQAVASGLGHTAAIVQQTTLDNTNFIANSDLLIISSGVITLPDSRRDNVQAMLMAGKPVYLQGEYLMSYTTTQAFATLVTNLGGVFSWTGQSSGDLQPMAVLGSLGTTPNAVPWLTYFWYGVYGSGTTGITGDLSYGGNTYGFTFDPPNSAYGLLCCTTDQDWARTSAEYPQLMENYLYRMLNDVTAGLIVELNPLVVSIPPGGGNLNYQARVTNTSGANWTGTGWTHVVLPNAQVFGPLVAFNGLSFADGTQSPWITLTQHVPAIAPPGLYQFWGNLGSLNPFVVDASDMFTFSKTVVSTDDAAVYDWRGDDWSALAGVTKPQETVEIPAGFVLGEPYPNPFNPSTTINLTLPDATDLSVVVYDLQGREVAILAHGAFSAGQHSFSFDAHGLAGGVYFLRASAGSEVQTRKLILMK